MSNMEHILAISRINTFFSDYKNNTFSQYKQLINNTLTKTKQDTPNITKRTHQIFY